MRLALAAILAGIVLLAFTLSMKAGEPQPPTCWQLRLWATFYGPEAINRAARARGATERQIRDAERRCQS